jgi:hypothetical protein
VIITLSCSTVCVCLQEANDDDDGASQHSDLSDGAETEGLAINGIVSESFNREDGKPNVATATYERPVSTNVSSQPAAAEVRLPNNYIISKFITHILLCETGGGAFLVLTTIRSFEC